MSRDNLHGDLEQFRRQIQTMECSEKQSCRLCGAASLEHKTCCADCFEAAFRAIENYVEERADEFLGQAL